ncbi:MAG: hypothetical protein R3F43_12970 [bacterium]
MLRRGEALRRLSSTAMTAASPTRENDGQARMLARKTPITLPRRQAPTPPSSRSSGP